MTPKIEDCTRCPRLRAYCTDIAQKKKRAYQNETYWGRPVPSFGSPSPSLLICGLAPAAHGANRTGRMFTGDRSGEWLYRALYETGFASQAESYSRKDGLTLQHAHITAALHCAPPQNRPSKDELKACAPFLEKEIRMLQSVRVYIVLGKIALDALWPLVRPDEQAKKPHFKHGEAVTLKNGRTLIISYHPSQQNTFTGRLKWPEWIEIFERARMLTRAH